MGCGASSAAGKKDGVDRQDGIQMDAPRNAVQEARRPREERRRQRREARAAQPQPAAEAPRASATPPPPPPPPIPTEIPHIYTMGGPVCSCGVDGSRHKRSVTRAQPMDGPSMRTSVAFRDGTIEASPTTMQALLDADLKLPDPSARAVLMSSPARARRQQDPAGTPAAPTTLVQVFLHGHTLTPLISLRFPGVARRVTFAQVRAALLSGQSTVAASDIPQSLSLSGSFQPAGGSQRRSLMMPVGQWGFSGVPSTQRARESTLKVPIQSLPPGMAAFYRKARGEEPGQADTFVVVVEDATAAAERGRLTDLWFAAVHALDADRLELLTDENPAVKMGALVDASGRTGLHWAAAHGDAVFARRFLGREIGTPMAITDAEGLTCLHLAVRSGSIATVGMLLEHAPVAVGDIAAAKTFIRATDARGFAPLHSALMRARHAADRGRFVIANSLRRIAGMLFEAGGGHGAEPYLWKGAGRCFLHANSMALRACPTLMDAVQAHDHERLQSLVKWPTGRADVAERKLTLNLCHLDGATTTVSTSSEGFVCENVLGLTALHLAVAKRDGPAIKALLTLTGTNGQLNIDAVCSDGTTAALMAARCGDGPSLRLLMKHGADPFGIRSHTGENVAHLVLRSRRGAPLLLDTLVSHPGFVPELLTAPDSAGVTPLDLAMGRALRVKEEAVVRLLEVAGPERLKCSIRPYVSQSRLAPPPKRLSAIARRRTVVATDNSTAPILSHRLMCHAISRRHLTVMTWLRDRCPPHLPRPPTSLSTHPLLAVIRTFDSAAGIHSWFERHRDGLGLRPDEEGFPRVPSPAVDTNDPLLLSPKPPSPEDIILRAAGLSVHQPHGATATVIALAAHAPMRVVVRRWCLEPVKRLRGSFLWRTLMLDGATGVATGPSLAAGLPFLRQLLGNPSSGNSGGSPPTSPTTELLAAEEKVAVAASVLRLLLITDAHIRDHTAAIVELCLTVLTADGSPQRQRVKEGRSPLQNVAGGSPRGRENPSSPLPDGSPRTRVPLASGLPGVKYPCRERVDGSVVEPTYSKVADVLHIRIGDPLFLNGCRLGCHSFVRRVLEHHRTFPSIPSVSDRAQLLSVLDLFLGTQHIGTVDDWWSWDVVFEALEHGARLPPLQTLYPTAEVLNSVVPRLTSRMPRSPPVKAMFRLRSWTGSRPEWTVLFIKAMQHSGFFNSHVRHVCRYAVHRPDETLMKLLPSNHPTLAECAVRADNVYVLSRVVKSSSSGSGGTSPRKAAADPATPSADEIYDRCSASLGTPLVHLACINRSQQCLGYMGQVLSLQRLVTSWCGLTPLDVCAALGWWEGAAKLAHSIGCHLRVPESAVLAAAFSADGCLARRPPRWPKDADTAAKLTESVPPSAWRELFTERYCPPLVLFAQIGFAHRRGNVPRVRQDDVCPQGSVKMRAPFVGTSDPLLKAVRFIQKPELVPQLALNATQVAVNEALQIAIGRGAPVPVIEALLEVGADPNTALPEERGGTTALQLAVRRRSPHITELLLLRGARPDTTNAAGDTALHEAYAIRAVGCIDLLRPVTTFPPAFCYGSWDVRRWFEASKAAHRSRDPSAGVSAEFTKAIESMASNPPGEEGKPVEDQGFPFVLAWAHPMPSANWAPGPAFSPYLQRHFPPPAGSFAAVPSTASEAVPSASSEQPAPKWLNDADEF